MRIKQTIVTPHHTTPLTIKGRHIGQESLRRADVAGGLVSADVLLSGLHRHSQRGLASRVDRHANNTPRHLAGVGICGGQKARMRAAKAHRHAESLGGAHGDVEAHLPDGLEQHRGHEVRAGHHQSVRRVSLVDERSPVVHTA